MMSMKKIGVAMIDKLCAADSKSLPRFGRGSGGSKKVGMYLDAMQNGADKGRSKSTHLCATFKISCNSDEKN